MLANPFGVALAKAGSQRSWSLVTDRSRACSAVCDSTRLSLRENFSGEATEIALRSDFYLMKRYLLCFLVVILGSACLLRADETIRALQTRLKTGGFYFGEITGVYDSQTAAGVTRYQIRNGLQ